MKKYFKIAFGYAIAAMVCGVFYREFTKWNGFTGKTSLAVAHLHFFVMGTIMMLIIGMIATHSNLEQHKMYKPTMILYNVALPYMVVMFIVRGILQTLQTPVSAGADAAISGLAGVGHAAFGTAIVLLFVMLLKTNMYTNKQQDTAQ